MDRSQWVGRWSLRTADVVMNEESEAESNSAVSFSKRPEIVFWIKTETVISLVHWDCVQVGMDMVGLLCSVSFCCDGF